MLDTFLFVIRCICSTMFDIAALCMLTRAILMWLDPMEDWKITVFLEMITEPLVYPMRRLCERMHWFEDSPLDFPFTLTSILIMFLSMLIPML